MRLLLSLLLLLMSCGGGSSSYDYKIALDPNWYALELPERAAAIQGFSVELLESIAKNQKLKIAIYDRSWDNLMYGLNKGDYDGVLSSMQPYLFYEKMYDFSDLYLPTGPTLVIPVSSNITSLDQLNGKEVAIEQNSNAALILEKYPNIIQRTYTSVPQALNDIVSGTIDGAIVDILTAEAYCLDLYQGKLKVAFPPLTKQGLRLITLHGHAPRLIEAFNDGLHALEENGTYAKLMKKWNLSE